jgi:uncharacterized protein involved in exopolysaccharide biosynthesis
MAIDPRINNGETDSAESGIPGDVLHTARGAENATEHGYFAIFDVALAARRRWKFVAGTTLALTAAVFTLSLFQQKWYRAEAVVRPASTSERLSEFASEASIALSGGSAFSNVLDAQEAALDGEKFASILQSRMFTARLVHRHRLERMLIDELDAGRIGQPLSDWDAWLAMQKIFRCSVNLETGNVSLSLLAHSAAEARGILGYYISELRDTLREGEISRADAAMQSLQAEAKAAPDRMLAEQLYVLVARQKERERVAEADAGFAFALIDAPDCPDRPYRPRVIVNTAAAAAAGVLSCIVLVGFDEWFRKRWAAYRHTRSDVNLVSK